MRNNLKIVVDSDAIIAQLKEDDTNHLLAKKISDLLVSTNADVIFPMSAILESTAFMQRVLSSGASAYGTALTFTDPNVKVVEINQELLRKAVGYFDPKGSKKNTLFDCIVAAVAEEEQADAIFSFDHFYKAKRFTLINELI